MSKRHHHNTKTKSRATANLNTFESSKKVLTFSADSGSNLMDEFVVPIDTAIDAQIINTHRIEPENQLPKQSQEAIQNSVGRAAEFVISNQPQPIEATATPFKPHQSLNSHNSVKPTQAMELYQSEGGIQPYPHPPLSEGYYHYLTTPPSVVLDKPRRFGNVATNSWGPIPEPENAWLGWIIAGVGLIIALIIVIILLQPDTTVSNAGIVTAVAPTATPRPKPTPIPAAIISAVPANEKWGMITADNGYVRSDPRDDAKLNQTLGRNTLIAFEKKTNDGWYMLAGGGWLRADEIKIFPNQQAAQTAITLAKANVTVSVGASSTNLPVPSNDSQLSPQQLSAAGLLTFPAPACNIKGELNSQTGAKTYYLPGQQAYASLSMLPADTHRWFCSEQDATKNGFAKSSSAANAPTPTPAIVTTVASPFTVPTTATPRPIGY